MPRAAGDDGGLMTLRLSPEAKPEPVRATALRDTDPTRFILRTALHEVETVIREEGVLRLTERDRTLILRLPETLPRPDIRLRAAMAALPKTP